MLTKLRVKNFKAWRDSGDIRLAPLTVLFGRNSAGKSSLGQLLLMLRQTATSNDMRRVLFLGDGDSLVDLGNYEDVVFGHNPKSAIEFELNWRPMHPREMPMGNLASNSVAEFGFQAKISVDAAKQIRLDEFSYETDGAGGKASFSVRSDEPGYRFAFCNGGNESKVTGSLNSVRGFYGFPRETEKFYAETTVLLDLSLSLDELLRPVFNLGPLRDPPRRIYWWTRGGEPYVGQRGERSIQTLVEAKQRRFTLPANEDAQSLEDIVAEQLKRMGLIDSFRVRPVAQGREQYEVLIKTSAGSPEVNLTDVGFGLSQVLPVVVQCFSAYSESIVLFEQPELHLHPAAQADLADVFIDAVQSLENGAPRGVQFIIESHSEHFLTRLQRRIAEEKISASEVAMYFVDTEDGEAKLCDLGLDEFGNVQNWPQDFFGNDVDDLMERTRAQYRRKAGASK